MRAYFFTATTAEISLRFLAVLPVYVLGAGCKQPPDQLGLRPDQSMRTFCEHSLCDWVHQGDTGGVCVLLEPEPILDSRQGPNALVMRRSGVRISEAAPRFWLVM